MSQEDLEKTFGYTDYTPKSDNGVYIREDTSLEDRAANFIAKKFESCELAALKGLHVLLKHTSIGIGMGIGTGISSSTNSLEKISYLGYGMLGLSIGVTLGYLATLLFDEKYKKGAREILKKVIGNGIGFGISRTLFDLLK